MFKPSSIAGFFTQTQSTPNASTSSPPFLYGARASFNFCDASMNRGCVFTRVSLTTSNLGYLVAADPPAKVDHSLGVYVNQWKNSSQGFPQHAVPSESARARAFPARTHGVAALGVCLRAHPKTGLEGWKRGGGWLGVQGVSMKTEGRKEMKGVVGVGGGGQPLTPEK